MKFKKNGTAVTLHIQYMYNCAFLFYPYNVIPFINFCFLLVLFCFLVACEIKPIDSA